jgi:hypothetical protein
MGLRPPAEGPPDTDNSEGVGIASALAAGVAALEPVLLRPEPVPFPLLPIAALPLPPLEDMVRETIDDGDGEESQRADLSWVSLLLLLPSVLRTCPCCSRM